MFSPKSKSFRTKASSTSTTSSPTATTTQNNNDTSESPTIKATKGLSYFNASNFTKIFKNPTNFVQTTFGVQSNRTEDPQPASIAAAKISSTLAVAKKSDDKPRTESPTHFVTNGVTNYNASSSSQGGTSMVASTSSSLSSSSSSSSPIKYAKDAPPKIAQHNKTELEVNDNKKTNNSNSINDGAIVFETVKLKKGSIKREKTDKIKNDNETQSPKKSMAVPETCGNSEKVQMKIKHSPKYGRRDNNKIESLENGDIGKVRKLPVAAVTSPITIIPIDNDGSSSIQDESVVTFNNNLDMPSSNSIYRKNVATDVYRNQLAEEIEVEEWDTEDGTRNLNIFATTHQTHHQYGYRMATSTVVTRQPASTRMASSSASSSSSLSSLSPSETDATDRINLTEDDYYYYDNSMNKKSVDSGMVQDNNNENSFVITWSSSSPSSLLSSNNNNNTPSPTTSSPMLPIGNSITSSSGSSSSRSGDGNFYSHSSTEILLARQQMELHDIKEEVVTPINNNAFQKYTTSDTVGGGAMTPGTNSKPLNPFLCNTISTKSIINIPKTCTVFPSEQNQFSDGMESKQQHYHHHPSEQQYQLLFSHSQQQQQQQLLHHLENSMLNNTTTTLSGGSSNCGGGEGGSISITNTSHIGDMNADGVILGGALATVSPATSTITGNTTINSNSKVISPEVMNALQLFLREHGNEYVKQFLQVINVQKLLLAVFVYFPFFF